MRMVRLGDTASCWTWCSSWDGNKFSEFDVLDPETGITIEKSVSVAETDALTQRKRGLLPSVRHDLLNRKRDWRRKRVSVRCWKKSQGCVNSGANA